MESLQHQDDTDTPNKTENRATSITAFGRESSTSGAAMNPIE